MNFLKKLFSSKEKKLSKEQNKFEEIDINIDTPIKEVEAFTRNRILGCLLGLAIGDAKGMPAESKDPAYGEVVASTFEYLDGYLPKGHFTDDTHHTTILAESIIDKKGFDPNDFMQKLANLDLRRGIGPTTLKAIQKFLLGVSADKTGFPSATNGPAMRVAPIAIMYHYDTNLLRQYVIKSTIVTHTSPESIGGALTVAFTIAYILNHSKEQFDKDTFLNELINFINPVSPELATALKPDSHLLQRVGCHVMESIPHAIRIFMENPQDFEKSISNAIRGGGDADTIASIVGALAGAFNGLDKIPVQWVENLENSEKGRDYLKRIAENLYQLGKENRDN